MFSRGSYPGVSRMEDVNPELESFREQWRREVTARSSRDQALTKPAIVEGASSSASSKLATNRTLELPLAPASTSGRTDDSEAGDTIVVKKYHDLADKDSAIKLEGGGNLEKWP